jgi:hypothetical protein
MGWIVKEPIVLIAQRNPSTHWGGGAGSGRGARTRELGNGVFEAGMREFFFIFLV